MMRGSGAREGHDAAVEVGAAFCPDRGSTRRATRHNECDHSGGYLMFPGHHIVFGHTEIGLLLSAAVRTTVGVYGRRMAGPPPSFWQGLSPARRCVTTDWALA